MDPDFMIGYWIRGRPYYWVEGDSIRGHSRYYLAKKGDEEFVFEKLGVCGWPKNLFRVTKKPIPGHELRVEGVLSVNPKMMPESDYILRPEDIVDITSRSILSMFSGKKTMTVSRPTKSKNPFDGWIIRQSRLVKNAIDYSIFDTVPRVSRFSSLLPFHVDQVKKIFELITTGMDLKYFVDGTAHIGVDTVHLAKFFPETTGVAIEIDSDTHELLKGNIERAGYSDRIETVNNSFLKTRIETNPKNTFVFLDPPWGGTDYKKQGPIMLYLDKVPIPTIIDNMREFRLAVKLPYNFDFEKIRGVYDRYPVFKQSGEISYIIISPK